MRESDIEQRLCLRLRRAGFLTPKLENLPGWPDRLIVGRFGRSIYIEFKTNEGKLSPKQKEVHQQLRDRGHKVIVAREDIQVSHVMYYFSELNNEPSMDTSQFPT